MYSWLLTFGDLSTTTSSSRATSRCPTTRMSTRACRRTTSITTLRPWATTRRTRIRSTRRSSLPSGPIILSSLLFFELALPSNKHTQSDLVQLLVYPTCYIPLLRWSSGGLILLLILLLARGLLLSILSLLVYNVRGSTVLCVGVEVGEGGAWDR